MSNVLYVVDLLLYPLMIWGFPRPPYILRRDNGYIGGTKLVTKFDVTELVTEVYMSPTIYLQTYLLFR